MCHMKLYAASRVRGLVHCADAATTAREPEEKPAATNTSGQPLTDMVITNITN